MITQAMLNNASKIPTVNFSTSTVSQGSLTQFIGDITNTNNPSVVTPAEAATCLSNTIYAIYAGTYTGTWTGNGGTSGTFSLTIDQNGNVTGSAQQTSPPISGTADITGTFSGGTTYTGSAGAANWTGHLDISSDPATFSGTWVQQAGSVTVTGTFTGAKQ